jgi:hypothetical protein
VLSCPALPSEVLTKDGALCILFKVSGLKNIISVNYCFSLNLFNFK